MKFRLGLPLVLASLPHVCSAEVLVFDDVYELSAHSPALPVSACSYVLSGLGCNDVWYVASGKEWNIESIAAGPIADESLFGTTVDGDDVPLSLFSPAAQYRCHSGNLPGGHLWAWWGFIYPDPDDNPYQAFVLGYRASGTEGGAIRSNVGPTSFTFEVGGNPASVLSAESPGPVYGMAYLGEYGDETHFLAASGDTIYHYTYNWNTTEFAQITSHAIGGTLGSDFTSMEFRQRGAPGVGDLFATNANGVGRAVIDLSSYLPFSDCNTNSTEDALDLLWSYEPDCNGNGIPDSCDPPCPWDFDTAATPCNGVVGTEDFFELLQNWGGCPAEPAPCPWDIDGSGDVGVNDFFALLQNWGPCE